MSKNVNSKTISQLLNKRWETDIPSKEDSSVSQHLYRLYSTKINDFSYEDLRFIIGQGILLHVFVPIAINVLNTDILAEGDFYDGDLLNSVLEVESTYWDTYPIDLKRLIEILTKNQDIMFSYDGPRKLRRNYDNFLAKWK